MVGSGRGRRKRKKGAPDAIEGDPDAVDFSAEEHAWWADREDLESGVPSGRRRKVEEPTVRGSAFSQYYSTASLFAPHEGGEPPVSPIDSPYAVLGVEESASWEQITVAHRTLAKQHHPDRLVDPTPEERGRSEALIRDLNIAYTELRRRRGK